MKVCKICSEEKPLSQFDKNKGKRDGHRSECKICTRKYNKEWRTKNADLRRDAAFKREYGIGLSDFNDLLSSQNHKCAICNNAESWRDYRNKDKPRNFCVDHDHKTGKVRGLLCGSCNVMLGRAKDSVELLQSAIDYLKENNGFDRTSSQ